MVDNNQPVTIAVPKSRMCSEISKGIFKPVCINKVLMRTMDKRSIHCSEFVFPKIYLPSNKPLPVTYFKREELLLSYKAYLKAQHCYNRKQKCSIRLTDKHKVVIADLKQRRYILNQLDDVRCLTDFDKCFFTSVNGRIGLSSSLRTPRFKTLKTAAADLLRTKQEIGIRYDSILNFEVNNRIELNIFNLSLKRYKEQVKNFDSFISEDYQNSMCLLEKCEKLKLKLDNKVTELQDLAAEKFCIASKLMDLDYSYELQQKYGRFLYYLSPPSWRANHRDFALSIEIEAKGFDLGINTEEDTFNDIFQKMQKECLKNIVKPALYFTHPHDLLDILDGIEKQQLHHFAYITHLAPRKKMLNDGIKCLKDIIAQESAFVAHNVEEFVKLLEFSNERCTQLESRFFTILNGLFYQSVGAPEVLKLFLHLEFSYERVFADKPINMDIVALTKALEECWMDYSQRLDAIHNDTVKRSVVQCLKLERRKMRRARLAIRELREFERLERELRRAHDPVVQLTPQPIHLKPHPTFQQLLLPTNTTLTRKSFRREDLKSDIKNIQQNLIDEAELEYLTLFTDWTEGDDSAKYLHKLEEEQ